MALPPLEQRAQDTSLLHGVRTRDTRALEQLYRLHGPTVHGLAVRIVQDRAEAEEITQDVFTYVWQEIHRYDPARGSLAAWLVTLARSRAIDRVRARESRERRVAGLAHESAARGPAPVASDPLQNVVQAERGGRVRRALEELAPEQRQAIEIAYFEGLSHSQIAARLGLPLGTVKTRIRQGMIRMRAALGEEPKAAPPESAP